jgi:transposase-like protein
MSKAARDLKSFKSLIELFEVFPDEQAAIDHLTAIRWMGGAFCPYCKSTRIMHFSDKRTHKCSDCRQRFSIKVGTIFEDTKLPLRKWFAAIWLITAHKKGIASTQLATDLCITQKSAWFVLHRLRYAARTKSFARPLAGAVESDETLLGGKAKNMSKAKRERLGNPKGPQGKTIIHGFLQRGDEQTPSQARAMAIPDPGGPTIQAGVRANVEPGSKLYTDAWRAYRGLRGDYEHHWVDHRITYVDGDCHTNGLEGFWSLFKRQYHGTHHWISEKHVDAYLNEMCYRWNRRDQGAGERVNDFLAQVEGRLTYKALIA